MGKYAVNLYDRATDKMIQTWAEEGVSLSQADRIEDGVLINLNHEKFYTRIEGVKEDAERDHSR